MLHLTDTQIPAVHDFGLFMALIVSCSWLWVSVLMPAALCIWTQHVEPHEHAWLNWWAVFFLASVCDCFVIPSAVSLLKLSPRSVMLFLGLSASYSPLSDEDDDVALLSVEMEPGEIIISTCSGLEGNESQAVKRGCSGTTKIHSLCLDQALVTQTGTRRFCPCQ